MLRQVLHEIEQAREPLSVAELARRLDVDQGALEGMIAFWVRKGRIASSVIGGASCATEACGGCAGAASCPFANSSLRARRS